jgi:hypothetical protein
MTENKGNLPKRKPKPENNFWRFVLEDIEKADVLLVNSIL